MSKHYCIFSAQYLPHVGGVERYTYYVAKKLIEKGNRVTVVASLTDNLPANEVTDDGIQIFRLPCFNLLNGRYPVIKKNGEFKRINKLLGEQNFDCVIVNTRFYLHSVFGVKFADKNNLPVIVIEHGSAHLSVGNSVLDKAGAMLEHFITSRVKKYCDNFFGVSEECCQWLKHFGIDAKGIMYNSCDSAFIQNTLKNKEPHFRKDYNISDDKKIIVFVGRMIEDKGIFNLIEAFKSLNSSNAVLFAAGGGPEFEKVSAMKSDSFIPLGELQYDEVITLMGESDIFCLPSVSEGFCTSVLEAVYCDCLICSTNVGGASAVVEDGVSGIIIGLSAESIKNGLNKALNIDNPDEMKKSALQKLEECGCTFESTTCKIIDFFENKDV